MQDHKQRRRWVGSHTRRTLAIAGGAVTAAALATAPGATAASAAPCAVTNPCDVNTGWGISATGNPEYPVLGSGSGFTWKYLSVGDPATENVRLSLIANLTDWTGHSTVVEAGVVQGTLGGTLYTKPTYYWAETNGSTTTYHPYTDGPTSGTSYKVRASNANGDGCWDLEIGSHTASTCVPGASTSSVSFMANGQILSVDNSGYKVQTKVNAQGIMNSSGIWSLWPDAPYPASPYKRPSMNVSPVAGHECYSQPSGMSGTTYMAAAYDALHTTVPTTMCSAAGW